MPKFESSQKDESRTQSADSSKAYRKRRAFYRQINNKQNGTQRRYCSCANALNPAQAIQ